MPRKFVFGTFSFPSRLHAFVFRDSFSVAPLHHGQLERFPPENRHETVVAPRDGFRNGTLDGNGDVDGDADGNANRSVGGDADAIVLLS